MRDRNISFQQFHIQLRRKITKAWYSSSESFLTRPVFVSPTLLDDSKVQIQYPRDFRSLRALAIAQWYFPEEAHWRIWLDLTEMSFSQLNTKQRLELKLLLASVEDCETYLFWTDRYSSNELFGNLCGNDQLDCCQRLRVKKIEPGPVVRTIRRRGYKDKGSRRAAHHWTPDSDLSLTELQNCREAAATRAQKLTNRIKSILRTLRQRES